MTPSRQSLNSGSLWETESSLLQMDYVSGTPIFNGIYNLGLTVPQLDSTRVFK